MPMLDFDSRITVGKLIRKSAGVKLQRQPVRIRPQPPLLRSGVTGNTLGFDPRNSRFDPWLRSLRTWPNGSGACLRNKSMRVRVLPSALFENRCCFVGLEGNDSGLVNRQRWFDSSTKLFWESSESSLQAALHGKAEA
jgi:hypothetical protein